MGIPIATTTAVRIDVARWRFGQVLASACVAVSILARRTMAPFLILAAASLSAAAMIAFATARRSFGRRVLYAEAGRLRLGDDGIPISRGEVRAWTMDDHVVRLYVVNAGWRFSVVPGEQAPLRDLLIELFGSPLDLRRRGSARGRRIAGSVAVAGLALSVLGIARDVPLLAVAGVPALVFGLAVLGALSQKVAAGNPGLNGRAHPRRPD